MKDILGTVLITDHCCVVRCVERRPAPFDAQEGCMLHHCGTTAYRVRRGGHAVRGPGGRGG
eukprot:2721974-Lingulodinium_polyedra.AAC.1